MQLILTQKEHNVRNRFSSEFLSICEQDLHSLKVTPIPNSSNVNQQKYESFSQSMELLSSKIMIIPFTSTALQPTTKLLPFSSPTSPTSQKIISTSHHL